MAYTVRQPIDGASIFELDDLAAQLPRDTRFYRQTSWLNWDGTFSAIGETAPEGFSGQSETVSFDAYDAQGNRIASLSEPDGRLMVSLYEYDAQGNYLGGTVHLDHELQSDVRYSYTFDGQGRCFPRPRCTRESCSALPKQTISHRRMGRHALSW